jgi:hypothetical protein
MKYVRMKVLVLSVTQIKYYMKEYNVVRTMFPSNFNRKCLCFQLVSGGIIEDARDQLISQFSPIADQASQAASAFQQQVQNASQNASSSALSQFEAALSSIQQNITAQISSAQEAEPEIQACLKAQEEKYAEILNSTRK